MYIFVSAGIDAYYNACKIMFVCWYYYIFDKKLVCLSLTKNGYTLSYMHFSMMFIVGAYQKTVASMLNEDYNWIWVKLCCYRVNDNDENKQNLIT